MLIQVIKIKLSRCSWQNIFKKGYVFTQIQYFNNTKKNKKQVSRTHSVGVLNLVSKRTYFNTTAAELGNKL